jgi:hypothetical protein
VIHDEVTVPKPEAGITTRDQIAGLQERLRDPEGTLLPDERRSLELELQRLQDLLESSPPPDPWITTLIGRLILSVGLILIGGAFLILSMFRLRGPRWYDTLQWFVLAWVLFLVGVGLAVKGLITQFGNSVLWFGLGCLIWLAIFVAFVLFAFTRC